MIQRDSSETELFMKVRELTSEFRVEYVRYGKVPITKRINKNKIDKQEYKKAIPSFLTRTIFKIMKIEIKLNRGKIPTSGWCRNGWVIRGWVRKVAVVPISQAIKKKMIDRWAHLRTLSWKAPSVFIKR